MEVSVIIHISAMREDGKQHFDVKAYPVVQGTVGVSYTVLSMDLATLDVEREQSIQDWLVHSLVRLEKAIEHDVHDSGYVAPQDLMLNVIKRKHS